MLTHPAPTYRIYPMRHDRWGIFLDDRLLATVGCQRQAHKLVTVLNHRLDLARLSQAAEERAAIAKTLPAPQRLGRASSRPNSKNSSPASKNTQPTHPSQDAVTA
jgi:hypothetical protein